MVSLFVRLTMLEKMVSLSVNVRVLIRNVVISEYWFVIIVG